MTRKKIIKYSFWTFILLYLSIDFYIVINYYGTKTAKILAWETSIYSSIPNDSIPDNIIDAYEKVFPNSLTNKIYPDLVWFLAIRGQRQSYVQLDLAYDIGHCGSIKLISIANQIDNKLTQKQCIYAYLSRCDFLNKARGLEKAAKIYYNKRVQDLNERECLELVIMTKNPSLFDKFRHQDKLDEEVNKVTGANRT